MMLFAAFLLVVGWVLDSMAAMAEAFLKWGGPKPMTIISSPTTRAGSGVARHFKGGEGINFQRIFFRQN